jgi:hypothetical protein
MRSPGAGDRAPGRITAAGNAAQRRAWAGIAARHGALPGIGVADKTLAGVACIRLDASVVTRAAGTAGAGIEEAHVTELTGLLREDAAGDQLAGWPRQHARVRPPRAAAPWHLADLVRGRGRLAVHPVGLPPGLAVQ